MDQPVAGGRAAQAATTALTISEGLHEPLQKSLVAPASFASLKKGELRGFGVSDHRQVPKIPGRARMIRRRSSPLTLFSIMSSNTASGRNSTGQIGEDLLQAVKIAPKSNRHLGVEKAGQFDALGLGPLGQQFEDTLHGFAKIKIGQETRRHSRRHARLLTSLLEGFILDYALRNRHSMLCFGCGGFTQTNCRQSVERA